MKKLSQFQYFNIDEFLSGKKLMTIGVQDWKDFETQNILGSKLELIITVDKTHYDVANGEIVSNVYEKLTVKIPLNLTDIPMNAEVRLINPKAVVYGEFRNMLSVTAENIEVITK